MIDMKKLGMPSCEEMSRLISQGHDRKLSMLERWKLRFHVGMCRYCTRFERQLDLVHAAIEKDKRGEPPAS
jgi:hypothetical protein